MIRATTLGLALAQAALAVKKPEGTIANQILWRADNTKAGIVREKDTAEKIQAHCACYAGVC